ncbi:DUF6106 family protein [Mediterraneibacter massiliensis]|jgi:hypothetical protein|uniref:DUF6106 family protein n=2 Tax=Mediterraneibacter massiliensis TaxID=1720300 RepID=UPI000E51A81B|nr:DUF6106 family protein [Mediterraneibacter massiliensis]RGT71790.1 hypothetical protein DWX08_11995 [Ruminococcus sp. AF18-22]
MNDAMYEQIVARKPRPYDLLVRILIVLLIVAIIFFGMPLIGMLALLPALVVGFLAYYILFPRLNVEYEYSILNHDIQIDAIYSKAKRKAKLGFDIQQAEIIAPAKSPRLQSYHAEKTYDFTSGEAAAKVYAIMISLEQKNSCVLIEPDDKMLDHMKQWMGMKLYQD